MAVTADTLSPLPPLRGEQRTASRPDSHVWLSASAGTGKTQVLAARVFRLLLRGVSPAAILCLTFTKAGAAEMAARISQRLAAWVRMPETALGKDLIALGEEPTAQRIALARTLFARVLDAPGGGLRIQTIHGFCQGLLAAFPAEAGLVPGFRPIEPREEVLLMRQALGDLLVDAEREGRSGPAETIGALSVRLGEEKAESFLRDCARAGRALEALPSGIGAFVRRELDLPAGDVEEAIREGCAGIDTSLLETIAQLNRDWGTKNGVARAEAIAAWLAGDEAARADALTDLHAVWAKADGDPRSFGKGQAPQDDRYAELAMSLYEHCAALLSLRLRAAFADLLSDALTVGRDYAREYAAAKRRVGAVDFDDLIAATVDLFDQPGIGEWVRFKLDQITEHVLIDEAQDTNASQWRIVRALVDEYFVGRGVHAPSTRTLFTVGDHKQAIFGFQGTDPIFFAAAESYFANRAEDVRGDDYMPDDERGLPFEKLSLVASFRSTRPVLEFVDAAIDLIGHEALGMVDAVPPHASEVPGPGLVELWPPVAAGLVEADDGEEEWIDDAVRENAARIAKQIRAWLDDGLMLESKGRALRPEDVMILVKRRGELAQLLVARLYAEGVPVAGVDRLRLNAPLAVQDLLAAIRFVLQPDDDLSLASLLVSPLIGWTQEELLARAVPRSGSLWRHLATQHRALLAPLDAMLARADFTTPYQFLEEILSGALDGRRKLLERLGEEARDPIEELLSAALDFETGTTPSLQRFLDWFDRGEVEIVRDAAQPRDAVRVLTAHGAKGLQAPVVILADATADPDAALRSALRWKPGELAGPLPVFRPRKEERAGPIDDEVTAADLRERQEHWRLFYVAATRAEERLVIAGSLSAKWQGEPPPESWYGVAARTFDALGIAGETRVFAGIAPPTAAKPRAAAREAAAAPVELPEWVRKPAPQEPRPARPLSPSSLGEDEVADPPPTPAMRAAAERGRLIHALFERLPSVPAADRARAADRWLADVGQVGDAAERHAIAEAARRVIDDPAYADLFGAQALAEAPISAVLADGTVVAGTVDRLLATDTTVRVVDFKTGRQVPRSVDEAPTYHLRQIAAYVAALAVIFPGRAIEAALLYTGGPVLLPLPAALLARHKPSYRGAEQS
ncbi:double-strand break repair helicase AddA [Sphingomonas lycopersici]|uniref:DNA 3'-5' helicase n=1 Tax=Sphingomonas lycopersici TaxID=2951807 RepID=A0AA41ZCX2_9SPHN|nr:double-strand break repair helicase AddA [Sphingomonas lycopersici]MCW6534594.1 double-strand break repair helicase AddA [Sphingomonas lycopersici]